MNPFQYSHDRSAETAQWPMFDLAKVMQVPSHSSGDENKHVLKVKPTGMDTTIEAQMTVDAHGDVNLPTVDPPSWVLIGYLNGESPIVLDVVYTADQSVPSYSAGERRIGHALSDANVFLDAQGNVTVKNDSGTTVTLDGGVVKINGGGTQAITDISTTKDADGHVTDITIHRTPNVEIG